MKKIFITLLTFVLMIIPITAFADTTPISTLKQLSSLQNTVQLKDLPVMIDGIKYAQNDSHVKKVTDFVFDDKAKSEGVVYGFTNQKDLNTHLQRAVAERKKNAKSDIITPQNTFWNSFFYEHSDFMGLVLITDQDIRYLSIYNDTFSSVKAGSNHNWTVMYWDSNYGGGQAYWVQSGNDISYLGSTWNDKVSSIRFID
ncbi:hypothetical protein [Bacillus toyonensis]|uniref:hypothetical protein n=3 Tax=Bacillus cereus group TaxID=86661 RepID=UPI000BF14BDF|nr:hypothetical protein [Bacillus toyonensis]PEO63616.1 hypothetical protein CN579_14345 [Bacillus toyonensis]